VAVVDILHAGLNLEVCSLETPVDTGILSVDPFSIHDEAETFVKGERELPTFHLVGQGQSHRFQAEFVEFV
jgi:hypothetical protein